MLDVRRQSLHFRGRRLDLVGKAFAVLTVLVEARGAVVSRDALYEKVWCGLDVEDGNLSQSIYLIRRAVASSAPRETIIGTLPRRGYRLALAVTTLDEPRSTRSMLGALAFATAVAVVGLFASASPPPVRPTLTGQAAIDYALGGYELDRRTPRDLQESERYFGLAIRENPTSAAGYAGLASAYALEAEYHRDGSSSSMADVRLARRYAKDAVDRDASSAPALAVAGFIAYRFERNDAAAANYLRLAIAEDPDDAEARHWYALWLFSRGDVADAVGQWQQAHRLSPTSEIISRWLGRAYYYDDRPEDALRTLSEAVALEPDDASALIAVASTQERLGHLDDAYETLRKVDQTTPSARPFVVPDEARLRARIQREAIPPAQLRKIVDLAKAGDLDRGETALLLETVGEGALADSMLAMRGRVSQIETVMEKHDPRYAVLRSTPSVKAERQI